MIGVSEEENIMKSMDKTKNTPLNELRELQHDYELLKIKDKNDISKHLKVTRELRNNEEKWQKLVNTSPDYIALHTIKGNYLFLNHYAKGYSKKDIIGKPAVNLIAKESRELFRKIFNKCLKTKQMQKIEYSAYGDNKQFLVYEGSFIPIIDNGKVVYIMSVAKDITDRKQMEEALYLEKENFRHSLDDSPLGIRIATSKGATIYANRTLLDYYGYNTLEELQKTSLKDRYTSESYAQAQIRKKQRKQSDLSANNYEISIVRKDGRIRHLQVFRKPVLWNGLRQFQIIYNDISERKNAEEALLESEAKFRTLFENSLLGISIAQPGGGLLHVNPAYARMYRYESPEVLLAEVHDTEVFFANPKDREEVILELKRNGFIEAREFELIRRDGSHFFALVSASEIRDSEGKLLYYQATHIDLTERKKTEENVRNASLYARNLIEVSLDPLVTINAEGKITDVNYSTEMITGIKREKLIGNDFADFFTDPENAKKGYMMVFSKGVVKDYPLTILHTSGRTRDVLYNATLFKNEAGDVQGVFAAARDITDRKKIEEELRKSKELLEKLNHHLNEIREEERALISREIHDRLGQSMTAIKTRFETNEQLY